MHNDWLTSIVENSIMKNKTKYVDSIIKREELKDEETEIISLDFINDYDDFFFWFNICNGTDRTNKFFVDCNKIRQDNIFNTRYGE